MLKYPSWVAKHKVKGTEIRLIGKHYRLYKITSKWDKDKKRAKKVTLAYLGTITESGLIPPKPKSTKTVLASPVEVKTWGCYSLFNQLGSDIYLELEKHFGEQSNQIWLAAQFRLIHQSPIKLWEYYYSQSYLTECYPNVDLRANTISSFLKSLGSKRSTIVRFFDYFKTDEKYVLLDSTHIESHSKNIAMAAKGYNSKQSHQPQVNLLAVFGCHQKLPIYYRLFSGNVREIRTIKNSIKEIDIQQVILIGDKGFCSKKNREILHKEGLKYIMPLKRDSQLIDYQTIGSGDKENFDGFLLYNNQHIWYKKQTLENGENIFLFLNELNKVKEQTDYLQRVEKNYEKYSLKMFYKKQFTFGTLALITNENNLTAKQIFENYKLRGKIEQLYDTFKNLLSADRTYMRGEPQLEAWTFINFIALMVYYRAFELLKENDLLKKYAVYDLFIKSQEFRKLKIKDQWLDAEVNTKTIKLFEKIGKPIT